MTFRHLFASLAFSASVYADEGLYHTTGTVISTDERTFTIQHGSAKWTFERGAVLTEPLSVGSTVTIRYHMVADSASETEPKTKATPKPKAKAPAPETKPKAPEGEAKKKPAPAKSAKPQAKKKDQ